MGGTPAAARPVGHHRGAAIGELAILAASVVLEGDLESETVCGPAKMVFGAEVRREKSQVAGHPRPPCGCAEYAMNSKPERNRAELDVLRRLQAETAADPPSSDFSATRLAALLPALLPASRGFAATGDRAFKGELTK